MILYANLFSAHEGDSISRLDCRGLCSIGESTIENISKNDGMVWEHDRKWIQVVIGVVAETTWIRLISSLKIPC